MNPIINSVILDRNITGENSQQINLVMILVTIVLFCDVSCVVHSANISKTSPDHKSTAL